MSKLKHLTCDQHSAPGQIILSTPHNKLKSYKISRKMIKTQTEICSQKISYSLRTKKVSPPKLIEISRENKQKLSLTCNRRFVQAFAAFYPLIFILFAFCSLVNAGNANDQLSFHNNPIFVERKLAVHQPSKTVKVVCQQTQYAYIMLASVVFD